MVLNKEAAERLHPAGRASYLGLTPGAINHREKESESMRKRRRQQRGRVKEADRRVKRRNNQTSSGLIQQNTCPGSLQDNKQRMGDSPGSPETVGDGLSSCSVVVLANSPLAFR